MNIKELENFYDQTKIHVEMIVDERMRCHARADKAHDLHFQIFRLITGYDEALNRIEEQQKKINELEQQRDEAVEVLIDVIERFKLYEMDVDNSPPYHHIQAMKKYNTVLKKITGQTWEEIKAGKI